MATLTGSRFNSFIEALAEKVHDLSADTLKIFLTNDTPALTDTQKSQITEIAAGNGYTAGGETVVVSSSAQTNGTYQLTLGDSVSWTATGGDIPAHRYLVLYNDTATNDELIAFWDKGSSSTLPEDDTFNPQLDGAVIFSAAPSA